MNNGSEGGHKCFDYKHSSQPTLTLSIEHRRASAGEAPGGWQHEVGSTPTHLRK